MDAIAVYNSDSGSDDEGAVAAPTSLLQPSAAVVTAAPPVSTALVNPSATAVTATPALPADYHVLATVEHTHVSERTFNINFYSFISRGYVLDPNARSEHDIIVDSRPRAAKRLHEESKEITAEVKDASNIDTFLGPWRPRGEDRTIAAPTAEQLENRARNQAKKKHKQQPSNPSNDSAETPALSGNKAVTAAPVSATASESSTLHIPSAVDYAGRSFLTPPSHIKVIADWLAVPCYPPKRLSFELADAHTGGVGSIRYFPRSGHLLLSTGLKDSAIKLYRTGDTNDATNCYDLVRSYCGHSKPVHDTSFNSDGSRFVSGGYDGVVRLWDTETGQCVRHHRYNDNPAVVPYTVRFHPTNDSEFLSGQTNRLIVQWDVRTSTIVTEYNEHLSSINTVTFVEDGARFVSTSDDKKVLVWDYGTPVPIKHISDPTLHSITSVVASPTGRHFYGATQNNKILVFERKNDSWKLNYHSGMGGAVTAGYACRLAVSNDGAWLLQGDKDGSLNVWSTETKKLVTAKKLARCHGGVLIDCAWHPNHQSRVATASWDGTIKFWE